MAKCTYTAMLEWNIQRRIKRIEFCMMLDTFSEEAAIQGIEKAKIFVNGMARQVPEFNAAKAQSDLDASIKKNKLRFKHYAKAKFRMGDYIEHLIRLTTEIQQIAQQIREHDCGPSQHPENLPEGARRA